MPTPQLPQALARQTLFTRLADDVPVLLAHPDEGWSDADAAPPSSRPTVIWMHGRTVNKELDPGRYLRWMRAGIATCAIDLPGHGERFDATYQAPDHTLMIVEQMASELDAVVDALDSPRFRGAFDTQNLAIGGMSAGGMVTLHRLTRPHPFRCAAVESTAGDFEAMRSTQESLNSPAHGFYVEERVRRLNPMAHMDEWRPVPLLALHSEKDEWVPVEAIRGFIDALRARYATALGDPNEIEFVTWPETGAPAEHAGFGRVANEAKIRQLEFLKTNLL